MGPSAPASGCANAPHSIKRPAFIVRNSAAICSPQLPSEFFQATRHSTALVSPPAARIVFSSDYSLMAASKNFPQKSSPLFGARASSPPFQTITASGSNKSTACSSNRRRRTDSVRFTVDSASPVVASARNFLPLLKRERMSCKTIFAQTESRSALNRESASDVIRREKTHLNRMALTQVPIPR